MKAKAIFKFVIAAAIVVVCAGEDADDADADKKLCYDELQAAMKSIEKNTQVCQSEAAAKVESGADVPDQTGCIYKCILRMEDLMEEDLRLTPESFSKGIGSKATGKRVEVLLQLFNRCNERFGSKLNPEETESCLGYEKFGKCLQRGMKKICKDPEALSPRPKENPETESQPSEQPDVDVEVPQSDNDAKQSVEQTESVAKEEL